jgi:hypothetical protein
MAEKKDREVRVKKPYTKPRVKRVILVPEEAVLGGCKTASVSGPATANCGTTICFSTGT